MWQLSCAVTEIEKNLKRMGSFKTKNVWIPSRLPYLGLFNLIAETAMSSFPFLFNKQYSLEQI